MTPKDTSLNMSSDFFSFLAQLAFIIPHVDSWTSGPSSRLFLGSYIPCSFMSVHPPHPYHANPPLPFVFFRVQCFGHSYLICFLLSRVSYVRRWAPSRHDPTIMVPRILLAAHLRCLTLGGFVYFLALGHPAPAFSSLWQYRFMNEHTCIRQTLSNFVPRSLNLDTYFSFLNSYVAANLDSKCSAAVNGLFPGSKVPAPPPNPTTPTPPTCSRCLLTTSLGTGTSCVSSTG